MKIIILMSIMLAGAQAMFGQTGILQGLVTCDDKCSAPSAKVLLAPKISTNGLQKALETTPNEAGNFELTAKAGDYELIVAASGFTTFRSPVYIAPNYTSRTAILLRRVPTAEEKLAERFAGNWVFERERYGMLSSLAVEIKNVRGKLEGSYSNSTSKESVGDILSSKITGNTATIEVDCDWGGRGTVQLTLLRNGRLHWKVIKRDESAGQFIVLVDAIMSRSKSLRQ